MQSDKELYFFIFTIKILDKSSVNNIEINEQLFNFENGEIKTLRLYKPFRTDSDYIIWATSDNPENFVLLKNHINALSEKYSINLVNSYLSIYERSPYLKNSLKIEDQIRKSTRKYLIFYPMSKSNDWYLLPFEERKRIMDEHIRVAMTDENNKDILS